MTAPEKAQLGERIREAARALGFQVVGVTSADPAEEDRARLLEWVAGGAHEGMGYMAERPERRADPREVFPGARSVLCLGMSYAPVEDGVGGARGVGRMWTRKWKWLGRRQ